MKVGNRRWQWKCSCVHIIGGSREVARIGRWKQAKYTHDAWQTSAGIGSFLSLMSCCMYWVIVRPANGMCLMQLPITYLTGEERRGEEWSGEVTSGVEWWGTRGEVRWEWRGREVGGEVWLQIDTSRACRKASAMRATNQSLTKSSERMVWRAVVWRTYPSATGITWVTPSPESITVPVNDLLVTCQVGYHTRWYSDIWVDEVTVCQVNWKNHRNSNQQARAVLFVIHWPGSRSRMLLTRVRLAPLCTVPVH